MELNVSKINKHLSHSKVVNRAAKLHKWKTFHSCTGNRGKNTLLTIFVKVEKLLRLGRNFVVLSLFSVTGLTTSCL